MKHFEEFRGVASDAAAGPRGECTMQRLDIGIADIDSYAMLFYGNYFRYNERAATACCTPGSWAVLKRAALVKYIKPVGWTDVVDIRSTLVPPEGDERADEPMLLHEWLRDGETIHLSLAVYTLHGGGALQAPAPEPAVERRLKALRREAKDVFEPPPSSYLRETRVVYADMIGASQALSCPQVMDYFERQRTVLIGGQRELERLKAEEGVMIVVYSAQQLEFFDTALRPTDELQVSSGYLLQHGCLYCLRQTISHVATGRPVADGWLKLVFSKDGQRANAPAAIVERLQGA
jgi:acyl-CoA thioesterase FadM